MSTDLLVNVEAKHRFAASAERVFDAWIAPETAARWLFATPTGEVVRVELDARPGGRFVVTDRRDGEDVDHTGQYLDLARPRLLAFTFSVPKYSEQCTSVTVEIDALPKGCELVLTHEGVLPDYAELTQEGWAKMLNHLATILHE